MKRLEPQAGPSGLCSGTKHVRKQMYTTQQVMFDDLDELQYDNDYSDSEIDFESNGDSTDSESESDIQDVSVARGRHAPTDNGDTSDPDRWSKYYQPNDVNFDSSNCGPQNISDSIDENSRAIDYVKLFLDDVFWENLVNKSNLRAEQVQEAKPEYYYGKIFKEKITSITLSRLSSQLSNAQLASATCVSKEATRAGQLAHKEGILALNKGTLYSNQYTYYHALSFRVYKLQNSDKQNVTFLAQELRLKDQYESGAQGSKG